ncbi:serine carboxypeptidase 1-like isoform X1 [Typha angustifolia]|uniref:serine carboxypeptidase 1-like isoform X1 n=1 Tax=Typha angustifolia TaxID=59011 RepID=UPI003C2B3A79
MSLSSLISALLNLSWMILPLFLLAKGFPIDAQINKFPGFDGELPSKHYAGYITVGSESHRRHLYYYFATSERNPLEDPITLWINGGPGCATLSALVHLIGPFKIRSDLIHLKDQTKIKLNPFSWTKVSSLIFVDSPAGTGYSYADKDEDYITDDTKTVQDLYDFIIKWFSDYPEFLSNPLYLAGCSYSGVIVPVLAQEIVNRNGGDNGVNLNLKGYSLGNAAIDLNIENNAMVPFAYRIGLISDELYKDLATSCNGKYWNNSHPDCLRNLKNFHMQIKGINIQHILYLPCHHQVETNIEDNEYNSVHEESKYGIYCHDYESAPQRLFDSRTARQDLHAMPVEVSGTWIRCTSRLRYTRNILSLTPYHLNLTSQGYRAFMYSGDHDMILPYTATLEWLSTLNYAEIEKWHPWFVNDQIAGYAVRYENNLLFATLKGAGHAATEYMPREALAAYRRWIDGDESL